MKVLLGLMFAILLPHSLIYLVFAFVVGDFNPMNWDVATRLIAVIVDGCATAMLWTSIYDSLKKSRSKGE